MSAVWQVDWAFRVLQALFHMHPHLPKQLGWMDGLCCPGGGCR